MKAKELFELPKSLQIFSEFFDPEAAPWEWVGCIKKALSGLDFSSLPDAKKKEEIPAGVAGILVLILFYAVFFALILYAGSQIISSIRTLVPKLPSIYSNQILPALTVFSNFLENAMSQFDPAFVTGVEHMFEQTIADYKAKKGQMVK